METIAVNNALVELDQDELLNVDGGMAPAALYALGFVMGMSPLGACITLGCAVVAAGAGVAVALTH